ncbi:CRACD-like protein isoform X3 [Mesocricetus auratus]|nr:CRACD-like protein isoform X3 [Mesocricetus auratus]XP_040585147.1 CRACD-like protein isoform X3 [Mesocricetus auratus]XP_040585148.1 CRACD-like protein isoform X3 [Mesocricetus auratus]XP_040585149.1 CRACD-like protein isoform X3 [Mesocricetus auratus]XP_040585150.1 CRACD-like protein isoform X3 [Mesocricetus auratus]XP_040585151.1 CRACD-like protein isoform X3 [Mesocricetus auratus]
MLSTRVMDIKLREAAEGLGEDGTGKKKSKFKTFKKLFGKKKRKESPSSTGNSTWKQTQAKSEVIAIESGPVGYDSEDELEESRSTLGNRALSHDSIFFPESGQDPARPVRVFSQENVCDRIKALQLKIQCNVKMGPPPPGGIPIKRAEETGMSSEDDGLPRSPPEMSLLHDVGPGTTIKILVSSSRPQSPDHMSDATVSSRTLDGSLAPVADFSHPPEFSSCLDNSAAKHKLLVKPRNQRSSKMRRLSSRAQSESLSDLSWTLEEEEYEEKRLFQFSIDEGPGAGQRDLMLGRRPELGGPAALLLPGGACARRARLQHSTAVSASMEEGGSPGEEPSSHRATPEVAEPMAVSEMETPPLPEGSPCHIPHSEIQKEELSPGGLCPLVESTSKEVGGGSGDVETPLSDVSEGGMAPSKEDPTHHKGDTTLREGEAIPFKEGITPPEGDTLLKEAMAPPVRDESPSKGDIAPPKSIMAPPERDTSPPETDLSPPKGDVAPPKRIVEPPERDVSPSKGDTVPPKRIMAPPETDLSPSEGDMAPPERDMSPPERDVSPSKGDTAPPKRIMAPPARDMSSKGDMAPTKGITEPPRRDIILPKGEAPPPETVTDNNFETPSDTERQDQSVQKEEELTPVAPRPEAAGIESSTTPSPSPPVPKSCLKHKALALGGSPAEPPMKEPNPGVQDRAIVPPARTRPAQAATSGGPEKATLGRKSERSTEPQRSVKRFSVTSSRARARASSSRLLEHSAHVPAGGRAPLLRSGLAWKSEAALDDVQVLPEPQGKKAVGGDSQDSGDMGAGQAGPGRSLQDADPCASTVKEPAPGGDQSPFPVKLRSTSLSLKYRDGSAQEAKAIKRYSAEVRLERGGLTVLPKDEQSHAGAAPALRSSRFPNGQGKGKSRSPEQPSTKPPLPRKPLLQSLTLPYPPAGLDASPGESERLIPVILPPESRKEKLPHPGAEKGQPPAATGPGADGQPTPPWITMARQKRRGAPDLPVNQEDKPGPRILKTETGKQAQDSVKQGDFVRSKSFLMTPVKPAVTQRQGSKLSPKEGLQRGISLSHQNLAAQAAAMTEKELHQLKRASYASTDQPSWMELARKKSQAWSDMPQIIK